MRWLVLIAVGCYSPTYRDCEITCTTTCPKGLVCSGGYCVANAGNQCSVPGLDMGVGTGPWSTATPILISPPGGLDDPSSTANGLELYFDRSSGEIAFATRASPMSGWGPIQPAPGIAAVPVDAGVPTDGGPDISADGQTLYFISNRGGNLDIWTATRDINGTWTNVVAVSGGVNSSSSESAPSVTPDGLTMVFNSTRSGAGDIYIASRLSTGVAWTDVKPLAELNGPTEEDSPHLSADKLTIYFHSARSGSKQLYFAERADPLGMFGPVQPISEVVQPSLEEVDPWVSVDGRRLYFAGYATGGGYALYEASR